VAAFAQAPNWQWGRKGGSTGWDYGQSVATDIFGNICVAGCHNNAITFGSITLPNSGNLDVCVVKYSLNGTVLWARSAGGSGDDFPENITTDSSGCVYVIGQFASNSITFGNQTLINVNPGSADIFLVKYDSAGQVLWARSAGGTNPDIGMDVAIGSGGNIYITGWFQSPSISFGNFTLTTVNWSVFVTKFDSAGNVVWARNNGGNPNAQGFAIATDQSDHIYIAGYFGSAPIVFSNITLANNNGADIFLVKYDTAGNAIWAKGVAGTNNEWANGVATDQNGNVFIAGQFSSPTLNFGVNLISNTNPGNWDVFVAKYDSSGNSLWAKDAGGNQGSFDDWAYCVTTDTAGSVYVGGYFGSSFIQFDNITLNNASGSGYWDIFVAKYDPSGNVLWAQRAGSGTDDDCRSIAIAPADGSVFITGYFHSQINFTNTLTSSGYGDIYLARLGSTITAVDKPPECLFIRNYPNPFTSSTSFEVVSSVDITGSKFIAYDCKGIIIMCKEVRASFFQIDRNDLPSGIYFYKLEKNFNILASGKMIIN
jgi:hypothetical protein